MPQKFGHAGECPATTVRVTHKRPLTLKKRTSRSINTNATAATGQPEAPPALPAHSLTCVAPQVDFQPTGFVVLLATSRKGAREELLLPKVSSVMGEQGAHGDERLLAAWEEKQSRSQHARTTRPPRRPAEAGEERPSPKAGPAQSESVTQLQQRRWQACPKPGDAATDEDKVVPPPVTLTAPTPQD